MNKEWENEPDYLRFKEDTTGWECIIKRTKSLGILCGYVVIPKDSALYNKHYNDELFNNIKVHGGLTFSEYEETNDEYLIGFDCNHLDDLAPYNQDLFQGSYKNIAYVEYMCLRLARQLYELSNTLTKSNKVDTAMTDESCKTFKYIFETKSDYEMSDNDIVKLQIALDNKVKLISRKKKTISLLLAGSKITCDEWVTHEDGYKWKVNTWICFGKGGRIIKQSLHVPDKVLIPYELDVLTDEKHFYDVDEIK